MALGATVSIGHDAANVGNADTLVYTGALWPDNPEYLKAVELGIPVFDEIGNAGYALKALRSHERFVQSRRG